MPPYQIGFPRSHSVVVPRQSLLRVGLLTTATEDHLASTGEMDATTSMLGWWSYWKRNIVDVPIRRPGRPPSEWITQVVNPWRLIASVVDPHPPRADGELISRPLRGRALDIAPASVYGVRPKATRRSGALPVHPVTKENVFILSYAAIPIIIQAVWYLFLPSPHPSRLGSGGMLNRGQIGHGRRWSPLPSTASTSPSS